MGLGEGLGLMRKARWLATWRHSGHKPVFYHCISRVVDRRFVLGAEEKEKFRALMRVYERFSGCRVLSYCLMDNHFHLLLEVPPRPAEGFSDAQLLERLSALYPEAFVAEIAAQLAEARGKVAAGLAAEGVLTGPIHERFTYRMHDLGEFMKGLLQRYTQWHNRRHARSGRLWEDRFKSLIVEDGHAARAIAAYIDLNPVRAGIVEDPAAYRWSSYGEAIGGNAKGHGRRARAGLVRAWGAHQGLEADAEPWSGRIATAYRELLLGKAEASAGAGQTTRGEGVREISYGGMLRHRIRYFTDGAVIGSRGFVDQAFASARQRFGPRRVDGARKLRGPAAPAAGLLWSLRDLRKGVT